MHTCPECGAACYCNGDIDDCPMDEETADSCIHCFEDPDDTDLLSYLDDDMSIPEPTVNNESI